MCSECIFDNHLHIAHHKDFIISFQDFLVVCKQLSTSHNDELLNQENSGDEKKKKKELNSIIHSLDKQV